jgi:predicted ATP-dependent endonuclease of OLD family
MKITQVDISNFLRVSEATVEVGDDGVVVLGGENGAGKSSFLKAVECTLSDARNLPVKPLHGKAEKGSTTVKLSSGHVITRTIRTDKKGAVKTELKIHDGMGNPILPSEFLPTIIGDLAFDPVKFIRMKPKEQVELFRALLGLDFEALDTEYKRLYDNRTPLTVSANKLRAQIEAMPKHQGIPATEMTTDEIMDEMEKLNAVNRDNELQRTQLANVQQKHVHVNNSITNTAERIRVLKEQLKNAEDMLSQQMQEREDIAKDIQARQATVDVLVDLDTSALRQRMQDIAELNVKVRENAFRSEKIAEYKVMFAEHEKMTQRLAEIDRTKKEQIANAKFPVDGVTFSESGDCLEVGGIPFTELSSALQLKIAVAIGFAQNPALRVILIRDGAFLDKKSMLAIKDIVEQYDAQVFEERVGVDKFTTVIMEDGKVYEGSKEEYMEKQDAI